MTSFDQERRRFPRVETEGGLPIKIAYASEEENARKVGFRRAKDVSRGGLRFDSNQEVSPNQPVSIQISLHDQARAIKQEAVVSWTKKTPNASSYEIGVEFVEASPRDAQLWERYLGSQRQSDS